MRAPPYRFTLLVAVVVAIAALIACVAAVPNAATPEHQLAGVLSVENGQYPDVDVYVVKNGTPLRRIGEVTGLTKRAFALNRTDVVDGSTIAFAAHSIGARARFDYASEQVPAITGQLYEWRLGDAGPGTNFLSQRRADRATSADSEPPNRRGIVSLPSMALRSRFGFLSVGRADAAAVLVLAALR